MMGGKGDEEGEEMDKEESMEQPIADANADLSMEAMHKDKKGEMKKEAVKEYKISKTADNADHSDKVASPVGTKGGAEMKTTRGSNIAKGGADEKGRAAPTAEKMGEFENAPGKDKATSFKKEMKPNTADGSEKSAKSILGGK
jgi:hypothetical protein